MDGVRESAVVFGRYGNLLGIVSEPADRRPSGPAVIVLNAGIVHRIGPSRVGVEVARRVAAAGHRALRFDLSGIGDSERAPGEEGLDTVVRGDIADAIQLMAADSGTVALFGICSGADNAFAVADDDGRVTGLALVDPTIHPTSGFRRRRVLSRLVNPRSWLNALSGRSVYRRVRRRLLTDDVRPPGYYGLLTLDASRAATTARRLSGRGVRFLYVLTGGVERYCNYPGQVAESMPGAIAPRLLRVEWRPTADHIFRRPVDRVWLSDTLVEWLRSQDAGAGAVVAS